jgi:hypothetical protein
MDKKYIKKCSYDGESEGNDEWKWKFKWFLYI